MGNFKNYQHPPKITAFCAVETHIANSFCKLLSSNLGINLTLQMYDVNNNNDFFKVHTHCSNKVD